MNDKRKLAFSIRIDIYAKQDGVIETDLSMESATSLMPPNDWIRGKLLDVASKLEEDSGPIEPH